MVGSTLVQRERVRSRNSFVPGVRKLFTKLSEMNIRAAQWIDFKWYTKYSKSRFEICVFDQRNSTRPFGIAFAETDFGTAQPPLHLRWKILIIYVQIGDL